MTPVVVPNIDIQPDIVGRFCLNDLHQADGAEVRYRFSKWLRNQQAQELIKAKGTARFLEALQRVLEGANKGGGGVAQNVLGKGVYIRKLCKKLEIIKTAVEDVNQPQVALSRVAGLDFRCLERVCEGSFKVLNRGSHA